MMHSKASHPSSSRRSAGDGGGPCRRTVTLALLSSPHYLSQISEILPTMSTGWKWHRAPMSILKAVLGIWIWYLQHLRLWRHYSWRLYIEAAVKNCFQLGFGVGLPHKHTLIYTYRVFSTPKPYSASWHYPGRLQKKTERFSAPS